MSYVTKRSAFEIEKDCTIATVTQTEMRQKTTKGDDVNNALGFWFYDTQYCDVYAQELVELAFLYVFDKSAEVERKRNVLKQLKQLGFTPTANLLLCFCVIYGIADKTVRQWLNPECQRFQKGFAEAKAITDMVLRNSIDAGYVAGKMKKEDHVYRMWYYFKEKTDLPKDTSETAGLGSDALGLLSKILQEEK